MRSKWKGYYLDNILIKFLNEKERLFERNWLELKTSLRASHIVDDMLGNIMYVHAGNDYKDCVITNKLVGIKIGQLVDTKKTPKADTQTKAQRRWRQEKRLKKKHK